MKTVVPDNQAALTDDLDIGSRPVTDQLRRMGTIQISILWFNLSIGILVIAAGALLATPAADGGLGLRTGPALLAIIVGTISGSLLLAAVAAAAHQTALPSMAMLRRVIGRQGSYAATILNIVQLVGWTANVALPPVYSCSTGSHPRTERFMPSPARSGPVPRTRPTSL